MHLGEIDRLLARHGYTLRRQTGRHRHYYDTSNRRITLALPHNNARQFPRAMIHELHAKLAYNDRRPQRVTCRRAKARIGG